MVIFDDFVPGLIKINEKKGFSSYFLSYEGGARIEIMHRADIAVRSDRTGVTLGFTHFAISVGSKSPINPGPPEMAIMRV